MNNRFFAFGAVANISESRMLLDSQSCLLRRDCGPTTQTCSESCSDSLPETFSEFAATAVDTASAAGAWAPATQEAGSFPRMLILCFAESSASSSPDELVQQLELQIMNQDVIQS